jgi:hypothetical protein
VWFANVWGVVAAMKGLLAGRGASVAESVLDELRKADDFEIR